MPLSLIASIVLARPIAGRLGGGLTGDAYGFLIVALEPAIIAITAALTKDEAA